MAEAIRSPAVLITALFLPQPFALLLRSAIHADLLEICARVLATQTIPEDGFSGDPVSVWCHRVCKTSVAPPERQRRASVTGPKIAYFHVKNGVLELVRLV